MPEDTCDHVWEFESVHGGEAVCFNCGLTAVLTLSDLGGADTIEEMRGDK